MTTPTILGYLDTNNPQTVVSGANLNALASGSLVLSAAFSNVQNDSAGTGMVDALCQVHIDSMAVSAGGQILIWFLAAPDGSTYSQGGTSVTPLGNPDVIFTPVVQTAAIDITIPCQVPICATIKALLKNSSLGATTPANANGYVKLHYNTKQIVSV